MTEYLSAEDQGLERDRFIPIRSRSEFEPTAACFAVIGPDRSGAERPADPSRAGQLELPLAGAVQGVAVERSASVATDPNVSRPVAVAGASTVATTARRVASPVPLDRLLRGVGAKEPLVFDWRRFVTGCALGSAAAAVLLMMVYLSVG